MKTIVSKNISALTSFGCFFTSGANQNKTARANSTATGKNILNSLLYNEFNSIHTILMMAIDEEEKKPKEPVEPLAEKDEVKQAEERTKILQEKADKKKKIDKDEE